MTKADLVVQDLVQQLNAALVISANRFADLALKDQENGVLREALAASVAREEKLQEKLAAIANPGGAA